MGGSGNEQAPRSRIGYHGDMEDHLYKPRPECWLKLSVSLRTFFVLLTLLCIWLGMQVKWIRDRHEALERIYQDSPYPERTPGVVSAPWSIRVLGETGLEWVIVTQTGDEIADRERQRRVQRLFPEANVSLMQRPLHLRGRLD